MNLLIVEVEDEKELLKYYLKKQNYTIFEAKSYEEALSFIHKKKIHLAILDLMVPNINGITLLKQIREYSFIPVIFLTSKVNELDKIKAFENGADDYILKPFNPSDLMLRVHSNLRRYYDYTNNKNQSVSNVLSLGCLTLDLNRCICMKNNDEIHLKNKEFKILKMLMTSSGRVFTTKQIYEAVWNECFLNDSNPVMVQISRIREKIEDDPKNPQCLKTIRGLGYKMEKR